MTAYHIVMSLVTAPGLTYGIVGALQMWRGRGSMTPAAWRQMVAERLHAAERDGLVVEVDTDRWGARHYHLAVGDPSWSHPYLKVVRKTMPLPMEDGPLGGGAA